MGVCYNRNAGFELDADLALLVVDRASQNAELLRLTFEVRRRVSQTRDRGKIAHKKCMF